MMEIEIEIEMGVEMKMEIKMGSSRLLIVCLFGFFFVVRFSSRASFTFDSLSASLPFSDHPLLKSYLVSHG